jgi:thiamine transport system substrate-binding protein
MKTRILYLLAATVLALSACALAGETSASTSSAPRTLIIMTHDSFSASQSVIDDFQNANNVKLQFLASGDTGTALNKAILAKDNPFADVFYGVDNTFLSRALSEGIFIPYDSPMMAQIWPCLWIGVTCASYTIHSTLPNIIYKHPKIWKI